MYNTKNARKQSLTKEYISSLIDDYSLFSKYLGDFKIGRIMNSPIRKDKNPSFCVYYSKKFDKLFFTDYGTNDSGDVFKLIQQMFNLATSSETLYKIYEELNLQTTTKKITKHYDKTIYQHSTIEIVRQNLTETDKQYWNSFGITQKTLKLFNVFSIKYYLQNNVIKGIYQNHSPMYAYKIFDKFKIYRPLANKFVKWRCNTSASDIQGYEQLPKNGDLLVITKSLKDIMVLHEFGINAIAPSSESTKIPHDAISTLKQRFKQIIVFYDRDFTGIKNSRKILKEYGFKPITINKKYKVKDISDYVAEYGKDSANKLINKMINTNIKAK